MTQWHTEYFKINEFEGTVEIGRPSLTCFSLPQKDHVEMIS